MRSQRRRLERLAAVQRPAVLWLLRERRAELLGRVRMLVFIDAGLRVLGIDPATVAIMRRLPESLAELDGLPPEAAEAAPPQADLGDPAAAAREQARLERLEAGFRAGAEPNLASASIVELFAFVRARVPREAVNERLAELRAEVKRLARLQGAQPGGEAPGGEAPGAEAPGAEAAEAAR